jgi:methionyl-tRNA synthetase
MLMSAGLPLPRQVFAHGFMLLRGEKMSKTRGNILDPDSAVELFGVEGVRYLVLREIPFDRDGDVTLDGLVRRYNADLANDLGNLVNRTVSMSDRYLGGALPALADAGVAADDELRGAADAAARAYREAMGRLHLDEALVALMGLVRSANGYAESQAPWSLNKAGETARVGQVLAAMAETCRILGHLLAPFAPASAAALHRQLGVPAPYDERGVGGPGLDALLTWGAVGGGWQSAAATPLFPRTEVPVEPAAAGTPS